MTDWLEVVKTVAGPLGGIVSGVATSFLSLKKRLEKLERKVDRHTSAIQEFDKDFKALGEKLEDLYDSLDKYREAQSKFADNIRDSSMDFAKDAELAQFMAEQNDRWGAIQKTLGHIEGSLGMNPQILHQSPPRPPRPQPRLQQGPPQPRQQQRALPPNFENHPTPPQFPASPSPRRKP